MYACFLDASKAFDFVDHGILFEKLMKIDAPPEWIRFLMSGYKAINLKVCWNGFLSNRFPLKQRVRQGGVLSPMLFSVYLDELLGILSESGCGLSLGTLFLGCIAYADDIVLLSTSATDLQKMVDLCVQYGEKHAIKFNASKTKCVKFSQKKEQRPAPIFLAGVALEWADEFVYLGHVIHSDLSISKDMTRVKHSFNQQLNLLMSRFGRITPSLRGHLFKTFCTSLYGIQLWGNELKKENTTR